MPVEFYKALWGMEHLPLPDALRWVEEHEYVGIETPVDTLLAARDAGFEGKGISLIFPTSIEEFEDGLEKSRRAAATKITVHAGKDHWTEEAADDFFRVALQLAAATGQEVNFETHRGRLLYTPSSTSAFLVKHPTLRLCADFSHWTCVCESLLHDQEDALALAISRVGHLHARVGHEEGPQVPDPRAERWQGHTEHFCQIWDRVLAQVPEGETLTVDPEFGPPSYLWTDPADERPLANLLEVCNWMRDHLSARWKV